MVLLDEAGQPIGAADRLSTHTDAADFVRAIQATPVVYGPWSALQVPQILERFPDGVL